MVLYYNSHHTHSSSIGQEKTMNTITDSYISSSLYIEEANEMSENATLYYIAFLYNNRIATIVYNSLTKASTFSQEKLSQASAKLTCTIESDKSLFCYMLTIPSEDSVGLSLVIFPYKGEEGNKVIVYNNTAVASNLAGIMDGRVLSGLRYRNATEIIGGKSEPSIPYSVTAQILLNSSIVTIEFLAPEKTAKALQIWHSSNVLCNSTPELQKESQAHLRGLGQELESPEEMMLESMLKNSNYQVIKEAIVKKNKSGVYELQKYKYAADYVEKKFGEVKGKLDFAAVVNPFLAQYFKLISAPESIQKPE